MEAAEEAEGLAPSKLRAGPRRTPAQEAGQRLRDNFKDWPAESVDGILSPAGLTLRQTLERDVKDWRADKLTMGSSYYEDLKKIFGQATDFSMSPLSAEDLKLTMNKKLIAACVDLQKRRPLKHKILAYVSTMASANNRELQAILNFFGNIK
eukprot:10594846-Lingulodinium_polyedra.AAC.1